MDKLKFVIKVITAGEGNTEFLKILPEFCNKIYNKYFSRLYDSTLFNNYDYTSAIKESTFELLME